MPPKPLISVVIPAFNAGETIEGTLASLESQTGADFEIIVIDDCSSDNTKVVLDEIQSLHPLRVLRNAKNLGHGGSRNIGIEAASGEYIVFIDADDQLLPGSLEAIRQKIDESEAELLLIGVDEFKRGRQRPLTDKNLSNQLESLGTFIVSDEPTALFWPPATWSKVYQKEFLVRENIRFPEGFHQDIPWSALTTLKAQSISTLSRPCYLYVRRGANSSTTNKKTSKTLVRVEQVRRIRERIDIDNLSMNVASHLVALATIHLLWGNKAAYRTIPEPLQEGFFHDSAYELSYWEMAARPGRTLRTDALFPTHERVALARALRQDDWEKWKKALSQQKNFLRIRNYFDPARWGLFKKR